MSISSKKPLYYQLKQTLLKWIEGGDYPPGSILPSEKQLQDSFGISRTTVRMALKELEQEGFLVRSPGKGTFVASMKIESGPRRILSFTQEMLNMGLQVSNQVVSLEKELPVIRTANKLQIPPGPARLAARAHPHGGLRPHRHGGQLYPGCACAQYGGAACAEPVVLFLP